MRFSLRNKHKIAIHYDNKTLNRILSSLEAEFDPNKEFDLCIEINDNEPYEMISINDIGHTCGLIIFYVISKTYDVYLLAFKEFIS